MVGSPFKESKLILIDLTCLCYDSNISKAKSPKWTQQLVREKGHMSLDPTIKR